MRYNLFLKRKENPVAFDVDIIRTGSSGNCSVIDGSIVIDLGIRAKDAEALVTRYPSLCAVLITHRHADHVNVAALRRLLKLRPYLARQTYMHPSTLKWCADALGEGSMESISLSASGRSLGYDATSTLRTHDGEYIVSAFECPHDVDNDGFTLTSPDGSRLIWATDTMSLDLAPAGLYDCICVEGNYDPTRLDVALADPTVSMRAEANLRHLSVTAFEDFCRTRGTADAHFYQLHMSHDFGRVSDLSEYRYDEQDV